ncbi:MAG: DUF6174 domain-containing protein [Gammaproteobacteria bacterium]
MPTFKSLSFATTLIAAVFLVACDDEGNPRQIALQTNQAKWETSNLAAYVFQYQRTSLFLSEGPIVISVVNEVVTSAFFTPSGVMVGPDELAGLFTITNYFDLIQSAIDDDVHELRVTYDATYGFPSNIFIDYDENAVDDTVQYFITEFQ